MNILKKILNRYNTPEIFMSNDAERYGRALQELKKNNIHFKTKSMNSGSQNRQTGSIIGQIGENMNLQIMYYIYVNKEDESKARSLIRGI